MSLFTRICYVTANNKHGNAGEQTNTILNYRLPGVIQSDSEFFSLTDRLQERRRQYAKTSRATLKEVNVKEPVFEELW